MPRVSENQLRRFELLQQSFHTEQEIYWVRFTGFATLNGGLFALATSASVHESLVSSFVIFIFGIALSIIWIGVQVLSLRYVDRWKPTYHDERQKLGFDTAGENRKLNPRWSSTDLGAIVPWLVSAVWVVLFFARLFALLCK